ncbi:hypothetical protein Hanom_Chr10g00920091 [Helianthus anomalus]
MLHSYINTVTVLHILFSIKANVIILQTNKTFLSFTISHTLINFYKLKCTIL